MSSVPSQSSSAPLQISTMSVTVSVPHSVSAPSAVHTVSPFLHWSVSSPSQATPSSKPLSSVPSQSSSAPLQISTMSVTVSTPHSVSAPSAVHTVTPFLH